MICYFVPAAVSFSDLARYNLSHICDAPDDLVCRQLVSGPFGYQFAVGSKQTLPEARIGYFPEKQEITNFGSFAIARDNQSEFSPASLLRPDAVPFHPWLDWSNREWRIPIARRWVDYNGSPIVKCALPQYLSINEAGSWVYGGVLPRHQKLWDLANKFQSDAAEAYQSATSDSYFIPMPSLDDVCDVVFGANYRVSKYEIAFLKVLCDNSAYSIMRLVVDDPGFELLQKKTV